MVNLIYKTKYVNDTNYLLFSVELSHDDLTAQATVFFIAGFETSSTVMSFALLELAMNPDIQQRARQEIEKIIQLHDGEFDYEAMQEMKYIDYVLEGN
jgi:cytochrome P450 family 6